MILGFLNWTHAPCVGILCAMRVRRPNVELSHSATQSPCRGTRLRAVSLLGAAGSKGPVLGEAQSYKVFTAAAEKAGEHGLLKVASYRPLLLLAGDVRLGGHGSP